MSNEKRRSNTVFCNDSQLLYNNYETEILDGQELLFDESYRLAHLPLVAPNHPRVIQTKPGTKYNQGIHELVFSIAIPIAADKLYGTQEFKRLLDELKAASFSHKISWNTFSQRKDKLHATVCSAISTETARFIEPTVFQNLREIGPVSIKVSGLFSGNLNIGRLYLKVYPELRAGKNMCHVIQQIFDSPLTDLYVIGLFNFIDELDAEEAQELNRVLTLWRDVDFVEIQLEELWMLKSRDDLVLNGGIEQTIPIL